MLRSLIKYNMFSHEGNDFASEMQMNIDKLNFRPFKLKFLFLMQRIRNTKSEISNFFSCQTKNNSILHNARFQYHDSKFAAKIH